MSDLAKTVFTVEPFLYWRRASMVAAGLAIGFAAWHRDSFAVACTIMAIGWALCDVIAWRDYRRLKKAAACKSAINYRAPDGTLTKQTHWCGCEIA